MKTSNLLKTSLGILITLIFIVAIMEMVAKGNLKECESRQSFACLRFTCPTTWDDENPPPCGNRAFICPSTTTPCANNQICVGHCEKNDLNCLD